MLPHKIYVLVVGERRTAWHFLKVALFRDRPPFIVESPSVSLRLKTWSPSLTFPAHVVVAACELTPCRVSSWKSPRLDVMDMVWNPVWWSELPAQWHIYLQSVNWAAAAFTWSQNTAILIISQRPQRPAKTLTVIVNFINRNAVYTPICTPACTLYRKGTDETGRERYGWPFL